MQGTISSLGVEYGISTLFNWLGGQFLLDNTATVSRLSGLSSPASVLSQFCLDSPVTGHSWSSFNVNFLHAFHLSFLRDLVHSDTPQQSWSWQELNGSYIIPNRGLDNAPRLPTDLAVPLTQSIASHSARLSCGFVSNH